MSKIKNIIIFLFILLIISGFSLYFYYSKFSHLFGEQKIIKTVSAATVQATDCSQSAVQSAINSASVGDTVLVPAGSCAWGSGITIIKGINLIGAGIGTTNITVDHGGVCNRLCAFFF
ncbi:MAG: hypothetical protein AAB405_00715 [Patescibacteria group bacterium]